MRNRFISRAAVLIALGLICLTARPATGQVKNATAKSAVPRMPDGHPDLQGTYDLATMTPLERQRGLPPSLTREQAEALEKAELARRDEDNRPSDPNRAPPPVGGDTSAPQWVEIRAHHIRFLKLWRKLVEAPSAATIASG